MELDKLEYHFKPDLELKYVFTHIEKSSLIKLLNTIFEIESPLSHILYTVSDKNKKGIDSVTFRIPRFSIHQNIYENTAITIEYPYTNLLKMDSTEFLSDDFILLSFIYFYQCETLT